MRLPISEQQQPRPYLSPFIHITFVTDEQTNNKQPLPQATTCLQIFNFFYNTLNSKFAVYCLSLPKIPTNSNFSVTTLRLTCEILTSLLKIAKHNTTDLQMTSCYSFWLNQKEISSKILNTRIIHTQHHAFYLGQSPTICLQKGQVTHCGLLGGVGVELSTH